MSGEPSPLRQLFERAQRRLVHEADGVSQIDDSRVGAEALRDQRGGGVGETHALARSPAEQHRADESGAVGVAASGGIDRGNFVSGKMDRSAR